jgi:Zn-dependent M28 family amino/carboxypeptidase
MRKSPGSRPGNTRAAEQQNRTGSGTRKAARAASIFLALALAAGTAGPGIPQAAAAPITVQTASTAAADENTSETGAGDAENSLPSAGQASSAGTEPETLTEETDAVMVLSNTADTDYGTAAMEYLQTIADKYPSRTNEENRRSASDAAMSRWIQKELAGMGYTVHLQEYEHFDYTGTNIFVNKPGYSTDYIVIGAHYDCVDTAGIDDNGSGVSVLLETARRFYGVPTDCSLRFVFFDNEEYGGYVGSYNFVEHELKPAGLLDNVLCYLNLDSVGAGDYLFAYGGVYGEDGTLDQLWPWHAAHDAADAAGVSLHVLPEQVAENEDEEIAFRTPTRSRGSDHYYFLQNGIPYVYFEASRWCDADGEGGNTDTVLTCHYETADPAFASTGGQIMHTEFDDFDTIEKLLPGRLQRNLSDTAEVIAGMVRNITPQTPELMEERFPGETEPAISSAEETEEAQEYASEAESSAEEPAGTLSGDERESSPELQQDRTQSAAEPVNGSRSLSYQLILITAGIAAAAVLLIVIVLKAFAHPLENSAGSRKTGNTAGRRHGPGAGRRGSSRGKNRKRR